MVSSLLQMRKLTLFLNPHGNPKLFFFLLFSFFSFPEDHKQTRQDKDSSRTR